MKASLSLKATRRLVANYIEHYNNVRLVSAISYVTPADKLMGRDEEIFKERDRKLDEQDFGRKIKRQEVYEKTKSSRRANNFLTNVA